MINLIHKTKSLIKYLNFIYSEINKKQIAIYILALVIVLILETSVLGSLKTVVDIFVDNQNTYKYLEIFNNYTNLNYNADQFKMYFFLGLVITFLTLSVLSLYVIFLSRKFCEQSNYNLQKNTLKKFFDQDIKYTIDKEQGEVLNKALFHCSNASNIVNAVNLLLKDFFLIIIVYIFLLYISWFHTLILSFIFIVIFFFNNLYGKNFIRPKADLQAQQMKSLYAAFDNIVNGFKQIKIFSIEKVFRNKIDTIATGIKSNNAILSAADSLPSTLIRFITFSLIIAAFYISGSNENLFETSNLVIYLFMVFKINQHIASLSDYIVQGYTFYPSLKIIYDDSIKKTNTKNYSIKYNEINFNKDLTIKNLQFSHDKNELLNIKNFKISKNFFYILYGKSGTGKSTLADLFSGFILPKKNEFKIDGKNYKNSRIQLKNLGYCNQDGFIFSGSFKENITLFNKNYNHTMYKKALNIVELNKPVYKTLLNKTFKSFGRSISGGQKQRINIARLVYNNPDFLILDEATNSIDEKSEKKIIKNLKKWASVNNKTVILITHNPSLKSLSKNIYELKDGNLTLKK